MKRKYLNSIEVWQSVETDDTAGGLEGTESKVTDSWCNIKTLPRPKRTQYGLDDAVQAIQVRTRYRNDLDYFDQALFFKYKGRDWHFTDVMNEGLEDEEITIIAVSNG